NNRILERPAASVPRIGLLVIVGVPAFGSGHSLMVIETIFAAKHFPGRRIGTAAIPRYQTEIPGRISNRLAHARFIIPNTKFIIPRTIRIKKDVVVVPEYAQHLIPQFVGPFLVQGGFCPTCRRCAVTASLERCKSLQVPIGIAVYGRADQVKIRIPLSISRWLSGSLNRRRSTFGCAPPEVEIPPAVLGIVGVCPVARYQA